MVVDEGRVIHIKCSGGWKSERWKLKCLPDNWSEHRHSLCLYSAMVDGEGAANKNKSHRKDKRQFVQRLCEPYSVMLEYVSMGHGRHRPVSVISRTFASDFSQNYCMLV
jgi:hypothetical protein